MLDRHRILPVFGMNLGTVGFLMNEWSPDLLESRIMRAKTFTVSPLRMDAVTVDGENISIPAINEVSLLRETRGCIVNFASPAGIRAQPRLGAYSAAKAAVVALTRALAIEEKQKVRVNAIAPGMIDTEQNRKSVENPDQVRWVSREQIASVVLFLCSDAAAAITGETIHVLGDGIE